MKISVTLTKGSVVLEVGHARALTISVARLAWSVGGEQMLREAVGVELDRLIAHAKTSRNGKKEAA